ARFAPQGQRLGHTFLVFDTGIADLAGEQRTPSGATLGGGAITLDGYRHPGIVQAGERLPLALFWRANQAIVHDYVVFVHLLDARDTKVAQRDLPPLEGSRPTSSWQAGELLRDDQDLPIPADTPAGRYRLVVGMYDAATFASINDAGPIAIGEVEIYR
ncbi:MAG TPA: phospholipid carrier-dependent glycosyltransferase, partial [Roseiflexaceae bacterium]|nr:phospholipid carrier-dependent glycosyltransferase [Roseiflexaceae bacterium]